MELDSASRPPHLVGIALSAYQALPGEPLLGRDAQRRQVAVGQEDQPPPRPQEPGRLWRRYVVLGSLFVCNVSLELAGLRRFE